MKKFKKQVKGITLIALVVTIIVLLILAAVAINLTIGNNGIFTRAELAVNTWRNSETNEQLAIQGMSEWIDSLSERTVDEVIIPTGFFYVGGTKATGLIISDNILDENKYKNQTDIPADGLVGNQFIWVPVESPSNYFADQIATLNTDATGTGIENQVTTNVYSNLTVSSMESTSYEAGIPGITQTEEGKKIVREPDILSSYDTDEQYYKTILGFANPKAMAESFVAEYKAMSDSVKKYKGFYIGRYELTGTLDDPTEKKGTTLTVSSSKGTNWYNLYKACRNVVRGKENVKSTMIYGVQWDATMDWLKKTKFKDDPSKVDEDSSSWGNYESISGDSSKIDTGSNPSYKANEIYDLAGNFWEWTQEAYFTNIRIHRRW